MGTIIIFLLILITFASYRTLSAVHDAVDMLYKYTVAFDSYCKFMKEDFCIDFDDDDDEEEEEEANDDNYYMIN